MFAEERKQDILKKLDEFGKVKVSLLSQTYMVSEATIRRDLQELEELGLLKRTHGGAVISELTKFEPTFSEKEDKYHDEKVEIGKLAASIIEDGETIALDAGTTTLEIARHINAKGVTVVTNSLDIAYELGKRSDIEVIVIGGIVRWQTQAMVGPVAEESLRNFRVDKAFLGTNGVCMKNGFTTPNHYEAKTKRTMMEIAQEVIFVCDYTKFNQVSFSKIADIAEAHMIITDDKISPILIDAIKQKGLEMMIVNS